MLLPQEYPYTDPIGILVCGGSTIPVSSAIDNCMPSRYGSASRTVGGVATLVRYGGGRRAGRLSHAVAGAWLCFRMIVAIVLAVWGGLYLEMLYPC